MEFGRAYCPRQRNNGRPLTTRPILAVDHAKDNVRVKLCDAVTFGYAMCVPLANSLRGWTRHWTGVTCRMGSYHSELRTGAAGGGSTGHSLSYER